jgi:hypothetical protein
LNDDISPTFRLFLLSVREGLLLIVGAIELFLGVKRRRGIVLKREDFLEEIDKNKHSTV